MEDRFFGLRRALPKPPKSVLSDRKRAALPGLLPAGGASAGVRGRGDRGRSCSLGSPAPPPSERSDGADRRSRPGPSGQCAGGGTDSRRFAGAGTRQRLFRGVRPRLRVVRRGSSPAGYSPATAVCPFAEDTQKPGLDGASGEQKSLGQIKIRIDFLAPKLYSLELKYKVVFSADMGKKA